MTPPTDIPANWLHLPRYDVDRSYEWNYDRAPEPVSVDVAEMEGAWRLLGWELESPLGVPAGPLLNGRWCLYYAALGFDVVTYKTVRSGPRTCYPMPNLQPVECHSLQGGEEALSARTAMEGSWAVSYGMPSQSPEAWRKDVRATRDALPRQKRLVVSVVGTVQAGWGMEELAADYAACGEMARESGADAVECNFSCPNVSTCDGQLYQDADSAGLVAARVRERIGDCPLIIKIGHIPATSSPLPLLRALAPSVDAIAATNSIATKVRGSDERLMFDGHLRGICGEGILDASIDQITRLRRAIDEIGADIELIGVGGAATATDVRRYLEAGAANVQMATAAMLRPWTALQIRQAWSDRRS